MNGGPRHRLGGRFRPRLVLMVKPPVAGRVKTRLAHDIGVVAATAFYRHASTAAIARLAADPRWQSLLAVTPDAAAPSRFWPSRLSRLAQKGGDLGARMQRIFDVLPPGPVVIVGTDIPGIRPADIAAAFRALGNHDAVFGPAIDGGYWLIGLRRRPRVPRAFTAVRWSHPETLGDNLRALASYSIATVSVLADVDTAQDLPSAATAARRVLPRNAG
jgi:rSAM/selenodomain-associated transferase 1